MALKGSFKMFGATFTNVYLRIGALQGGARAGWQAPIEVFQDADAVTAWRTLAAANQKAAIDYQQSLVVSAQAAQALISDPENPDKKAAHDAAVVAEKAAQAALAPSADATNKAQAAILGVPWQQSLKIGYVSGQDPIASMYAALKTNPDYSGMTDA